MEYKALYFSFNISDKNLLLLIYYQVYKYKIVALFEVIGTADFNTLFIYFEKCYIQYIISSTSTYCMEETLTF